MTNAFQSVSQIPQFPMERTPETIGVNTTSIESPLEKHSVEIPPCYEEFHDSVTTENAPATPSG